MADNAETKQDSETTSDDRGFPSMNMLFEGADELQELLCDETDSSACSLWKTIPRTSGKEEVNMYTKLWQEEFLTDLTLLVGPDQTRIKVHRIVLAAHFEYFRAMFSAGLRESSSTEVHLPFVGPDDLRLILNYAYSGEANVNKENMFKMTIMANYFGSENLLDLCCESFKKYINLKNCVRFLETAFQWNINQLKNICVLFIVDHLPEISENDLSALPVDLLLEIIKHPAAVMHEDDDVNEKELFYLVWNKIKSTPEEPKTDLILKVLKAVHLPRLDKAFLFDLLRECRHIPEAQDLIFNAGDDIDVSETREWYLPRANTAATVWLFDSTEIEVKRGITTNEYSQSYLIKGLPFFVFATSPNEGKNQKEYYVESPVAIEHLGLQVIVKAKKISTCEWVEVNVYHKGVVDKFPMDRSFKDEDRTFYLKVEFH